jgi:hypothetical protein
MSRLLTVILKTIAESDFANQWAVAMEALAELLSRQPLVAQCLCESDDVIGVPVWLVVGLLRKGHRRRCETLRRCCFGASSHT